MVSTGQWTHKILVSRGIFLSSHLRAYAFRVRRRLTAAPRIATNRDQRTGSRRDGRKEPGIAARRRRHRLKVSSALTTAGPPTIRNTQGRMNRIIGIVSMTGSWPARASKASSRVVRISLARMRSAWASGVP